MFKETYISKETRINGAISANRLRVIGEGGEQLGILTKQEALRLAAEQGLDLIEVSPSADPPVARIVDWGKFNYQRTKQAQKNKRSTKVQEVKQIRMGLKISEHDLDVKLKKATDLLESGHKVKITLFYKGRELAHQDLGFKLAEKITNKYADSIIIEQQPQLLGKQLSFMIRSNTHAKAKNS